MALFLHRDSHTFASMGLHSNHRVVNPKNFLKAKDDKPPIALAIQEPGNDSFQTSQVDISFYKIGVKDREDDRQPCLRSVCLFDYNDEDSAGKHLFVIDDVCIATDIQRPHNLCLLRTNTADKIRGALLLDTALTGLWPGKDDWTMWSMF